MHVVAMETGISNAGGRPRLRFSIREYQLILILLAISGSNIIAKDISGSARFHVVTHVPMYLTPTENNIFISIPRPRVVLRTSKGTPNRALN
jgi:hypothetical protein